MALKESLLEAKPFSACCVRKWLGGRVLEMTLWVSNGLLNFTPQSAGIISEATHYILMFSEMEECSQSPSSGSDRSQVRQS